jgi:hypothetical protein
VVGTWHQAVQTALRSESTSCRSASETTAFSSRQAAAVHDRDVLSDRGADCRTARRSSAMSPTLLVPGLMLDLDPRLHVSTSLNGTSQADEPQGRIGPAFPLVSTCVEPPAGIEPATPSLPSMRGPFTSLCHTSRAYAGAQVTGAAENWVVGQREATCSAVSGKSLTRSPSPPSPPRTSARAGPPGGPGRRRPCVARPPGRPPCRTTRPPRPWTGTGSRHPTPASYRAVGGVVPAFGAPHHLVEEEG